MNRSGSPLVLRPDFKPLLLMALAGCILFLALQVYPALYSGASTPQPIDKSEAAAAAQRFYTEQMTLSPGSSQEPLVTYTARSELYGYLMKEKLVQLYDEQFKEKYPYELYRVTLDQGNSNAIHVDVNMHTGAIAGFTYDSQDSGYEGAMLQEGRAQRQLLLLLEGELTLAEKQALAAPWVQRAGYDPEQLTMVTGKREPGLIYRDPDAKAGDAVLQLAFTFENGQLRSFEPAFAAPESHLAYVDQQTMAAVLLTLLGYGLFTLLLGILAVIYSVRTRMYISWKRGVLLAVIVFVTQMLNVYNMLPSYEAQGMSETMIGGRLLFYAGYSLVFSALVYFSLAGGTGLWLKEDGLNPFPEVRETGYGRYVLQSMKLGYVWAFILMGVQSIIFVVLGLTLNTWSTIDASQSPYNMLYPWLFPLMAWFAGIMEETVYRLFGIKMLSKIFRSTLAASLISSLIWALGHTLYPIFPIISRPIELIVIGLLFSFIFLRYGYLAVMFSHIVFNSILMGFSLAMMNGTGNILTGIFYMLLPAIVGYLIHVFHRPKILPGPAA
ncbi:CPBP family intramembrane metalloprotease [Paenibacillus sp. F411]|uniref:CPBP family intramembrane glutamic endopeptidase n=1 Tax=Paenibacillus sp. F411 TaxID=2820239 RepID=UPI001AAF7AF5|nr:type II CAAX endopeptidase family protein [Paenibacillus sp. F411]MBO2943854.1 CPBP family intramembrane metalloprotease [Paenibacillus sp. F411]